MHHLPVALANEEVVALQPREQAERLTILGPNLVWKDMWSGRAIARTRVLCCQDVPYKLERLPEEIRLSSPLRSHSQAKRSCAIGL